MLRYFGKNKENKQHKRSRTRQQKDFQYYWSRHWEIIVAAIAAIIVGLFIAPMFFR
jgi:LPS O-antigen subunit length determinant protein (WzzB/FepE family)